VTGASSHTSSQAGCGGRVLRGLRASHRPVIGEEMDSPSSLRQQVPTRRGIFFLSKLFFVAKPSRISLHINTYVCSGDEAWQMWHFVLCQERDAIKDDVSRTDKIRKKIKILIFQPRVSQTNGVAKHNTSRRRQEDNLVTIFWRGINA
jgi:hypothetical protein